MTKVRAGGNISTAVTSSLLRQSPFGSAQSLPANISQAHGNINASGDATERYVYQKQSCITEGGIGFKLCSCVQQIY